MNEPVDMSPAQSSLGFRLRSGISWNLAGVLFNQGSTFAVSLVVSNLLGQRVFGEYSMLVSTLAMATAVGSLGIGYTTTKFVAEFRSTDVLRTGRILGLCRSVAMWAAGLTALTLVLGARWLASHALGAPELGLDVMLAGAAVFFVILNNLQMAVLGGLESYPALGKIGILSGMLYFLLCATGAWYSGLHGVLIGLVLSAVPQWLFLNWQVRRELRLQGISIPHGGYWRERNVILHFALPAAMSGLVDMPAFWLANTFLARQPGGYDQLALFGAANSLRALVLFIPAIVNGVSMSLLNHQRGIGDGRRYRKLFWLNLQLSVGVALCGAAMLAGLGSWILRLFGKSFTDGYSVVLVLMAAALPEAAATALYQVIQAQGRMWLSFFLVSIPRDMVIVVAAAFLSPKFGAHGLAGAYVAGWSLALLAIMALVRYTGLTQWVLLRGDRLAVPIPVSDRGLS